MKAFGHASGTKPSSFILHPYSSCPSALHLRHLLVGVAPHPPLARLDGADDRMFRPVVVLRGVLVLRRVAAADVAALEGEAEVDPVVAHIQGLLTSLLRVPCAGALLGGAC